MFEKSSKRFLFITYYFPPAGGPAVQRIIKIIQYMAKMDWYPIVLTVKNGDYTSLDPNLEKEIPPETEVIRTDIFEPYTFYRRFVGKKADEKIPLAVLSSHQKAGWKEKIANTIRANLFIPDARIGWYAYGVKAGIQAVQEYPDIRLILSSGPPHTVHLIARSIAKKTGRPFVADFRDPWLHIDYYHAIKRSRITLAIDKYLEGKILSDADAITVVSPRYRDFLIMEHENINLEHFHIVYNGFDPEVYPQPRPSPPTDKFTMTYIGNLPNSRFTPAFFSAISNLQKDNKINAKSFQINFYGDVDKFIRDELSKFHIDDFLHFHDFITHQNAMQKICESNLLLLIINDTPTKKGIVPGKLFEYLGSGQNILCIGPSDGDSANILNETKSGVTFDYSEVERIEHYIYQQYQKWEKGEWMPLSTTHINQYKRSEQLKKMLELFNSIIN